MSSRWVARIIAIMMLIGFILLMANLQRRLMEMRQRPRAAPTSTR